VRWGVPTAIGMLVGFVALIAVLELGVPLLKLPVDVENLLIWVIGYGVILAALAVLTRARGTGTWAGDFGLRFRWFDTLIGLGSGLGAHLVGGLIGALLVLLVGGASRGNVAAESENGIFLVLNGFVAVVLVAPIAEELLFRGLILRSIRNAMLRRQTSPSKALRAWAAITAVAVSSVLFSAVHLYEGWGSPATIVALGSATLVLGIVNGVYAVTTNRLWPGIATHMAFNLLAAVVAALEAHGS
jgi:membrane protease YdiL (CAAX protease family)